MSDDDRYDFGGLFFAIAVPVVVSSLIGFYTGIVPVHMCLAAFGALYLVLCIANSLNTSYNEKRRKHGGRRR
jgi:uncharacterized membrane protein YkvI